MAVKISYDPAKRATTLAARGLDFADASGVFRGRQITMIDDRIDYGEMRMVTIGLLAERMVVLVWTPRGATRRIISMRKANDREQRHYASVLGGS